jgi:hypothetical protein
MAQTATKLAMEEQAPAPSSFADLVLGAKLELYACLQLLAERARFVTGASWSAIALREGEHLVYRAATGNNSPEIGTESDISPNSSLSQPIIQSDRQSLFGPVLRDGQMLGFVQLGSNSFEFPDEDWRLVARIAELIETAIDHMQAAEHSRELILTQTASDEQVQELVFALPSAGEPEQLAPADPTEKPKPVVLFWHAPEGSQAASSSAPIKPNSNIAVCLCQSCGFPVSHGRKICMECEERGRVAPAPLLFNSENQASWIRAHGYTIASLLLPAVAAALIYWLR